MALSSTTTKSRYNGDGTTIGFATGFKFVANSHVQVVHQSAAGVETTWVEGTHYTLTGAGISNGGTVTVSTDPTNYTPAAGTTLTIFRVAPNTQAASFPLGGPFPSTATEEALDLAAMRDQQLDEKIARAISAPVSDPTAIDMTLPAKTTRQGKVLGFDPTTGDPVASTMTLAAIEAGATDAAASAAAALAAKNAAAASETGAAASAGTATTKAAEAAASAAAALASVEAVLWNDVVFLTSADSPRTIANADKGKLFAVDCSSGAVTINLPQISGLTLTDPWSVGIKKTDASGNAVAIARAGTDTIDGGASKTLAIAGSGTTLIPDADPSPDVWTSADFGAVAGNMSEKFFSGNGATTAFALDVAPGAESNLAVYISGVRQPSDAWSLSGTTLTFAVAPPSGTNNIYTVAGTTLSVGTPGDGTVTFPKVAASAIASQAEAQAGTAADKLMTAQRTREGVNATPGMAVHLQTLTASSSSELIFTGFNSALYSDYEIVISNLAPSASGPGFLLRMSVDGGATFRSTAGDYIHNAQAISDTSASGGGSTSATEIHIHTNLNGIGQANFKLSGRYTLHDPSAGNGVQITGICHHRKTDGGPVTSVVGGTFKGTNDPVNGLRFYPSSGNFASGTIRVYGIRK